MVNNLRTEKKKIIIIKDRGFMRWNVFARR